MIIVRSPLRITLGGGGTDLPSYYRQHEGFCISAAIDKYVYVTVIKPFKPGIYLKYSKIEQVEQFSQIEHPIVREALEEIWDDGDPPQIEITTLADIPAGTGLGSSSSFTTALLRALHTHQHMIIDQYELAEFACDIEIENLKQPIGKQDQYIASFGGITSFVFSEDYVLANPVIMDDDSRHSLQDNILLFFTGFSRSASKVLADQDQRTRALDPVMLDSLHRAKDRGFKSREFLEKGDLHSFGAQLHDHWLDKRERFRGMSNPQIDAWYSLARENGAIGGKLIGAGGGGFLMFYAEEGKAALRAAMRKAGLPEVRFHFDYEGTKVIAQ